MTGFVFEQGPALAALQAKVRAARTTLVMRVGEIVPNCAARLAQNLRDASPVGEDREEESTPPGDEPGKLVESYRVQLESGPNLARARVLCVQPTKLRWVREGTGIYGPLGRPIRPRRARFLRWTSQGATHFAHQVRGMPPRDFVTPVVAESMAYTQEQFHAVFEEILDLLRG